MKKVFSREKYINDPDPAFCMSRDDRELDPCAKQFEGLTEREIIALGSYHYGSFDDWMEEREDTNE